MCWVYHWLADNSSLRNLPRMRNRLFSETNLLCISDNSARLTPLNGCYFIVYEHTAYLPYCLFHSFSKNITFIERCVIRIVHNQFEACNEAESCLASLPINYRLSHKPITFILWPAHKSILLASSRLNQLNNLSSKYWCSVYAHNWIWWKCLCLRWFIKKWNCMRSWHKTNLLIWPPSSDFFSISNRARTCCGKLPH